MTDFAFAFFVEPRSNKSRANQSLCWGQIIYMLRKYEAEQVSEAHIGRHVPRAQGCDGCLSGLSRAKSIVLICKGLISFTPKICSCGCGLARTRCWVCPASVQLAPTIVYHMRARLLLPPRIETYLSQRACIHLGMHKRIRLQRYSGYPENLTFLLSDTGTWDSVGQ